MATMEVVEELISVITEASDPALILTSCQKLQNLLLTLQPTIPDNVLFPSPSPMAILQSDPLSPVVPECTLDRVRNLLTSIQHESSAYDLKVSELSFQLYPKTKIGLDVSSYNFLRVLNTCCHVLLHLEALLDFKLRFPLMLDSAIDLLDFPDYRSHFTIFDDWTFQHRTIKYSPKPTCPI